MTLPDDSALRAEPPASESSPPAPEVPAGCPWTIVLGIDPGTVVLGYGALVLRPEGPRLLAAGVLRATRTAPVPTRLGHLRLGLDDLIRRLKPTVVALEEAFAASNVQSALRIGEARGLVLGCAACSGAEIEQYPPAVAKKTLTGSGSAGKEQVARMVAHELGLTEIPRPLDATDALAIALTAVHKRKLRSTLSR